MEPLPNLVVRYLHVVGAVVWVGGYAILALAIVPRLANGARGPVSETALSVSRLLSMAGGATLLLGLVLVPLTRGFGELLSSQWGISVLVAIVLSVAMMGLGDGALRPALRRVAGGDAEASRRASSVALAALVLGLVVLLIMLRMPRMPV